MFEINFKQAKQENEQRLRMLEYDQAMAAAAASAANASPTSAATNSNMKSRNQHLHQQQLINNEMIKELKKRNPNQPGGFGARTRAPPSKKEINIEDLIEEINRGYVTADAERRKRQRTQEIKKEFVKSSPIQII